MNEKQTNHDTTPLFAITMGDPAGIGPELCLKIFPILQSIKNYRFFIIGDISIIEYYHTMYKYTFDINRMESAAKYSENSLNVLSLDIITPDTCSSGSISATSGRAAYSYIIHAINMAKSGDIAGVITNPIHKISLQMAGIRFPGHTEIFAHETNTPDYSMMFLLNKIGVVHVTTHCSLKQALQQINKKCVLKNIYLLYHTLKACNCENPHIAVSGLNPHAGEGGLFGDEEIEHIIPAIKKAQMEHISVTGPYPPDTVFMRAFSGEFHGIVSMLHDHGFVALKSKDFHNGVNITVGIPIIRTSVGHGTAFDIVGKNCASSESLESACKIATYLYSNQFIAKMKELKNHVML